MKSYRTLSPFSLPKQQGFTLLEIMVVVGLIALLAVSIVLTVPSGKGNNLQLEQKNKLAIVLRHLSQKAMLEQRWYGLHFQGRSYRPVYFNNKKWTVQTASSQQEIDSDITFELLIDNQFVSTDDHENNASVDVLTAEEDFVNTNSLVQEHVLPQIKISPTGLFNHFELRFGETQDEETVLKDPYAKS
jgi:general secretion pathway protein H